jgi:hypothetical protein
MPSTCVVLGARPVAITVTVNFFAVASYAICAVPCGMWVKRTVVAPVIEAEVSVG